MKNLSLIVTLFATLCFSGWFSSEVAANPYPADIAAWTATQKQQQRTAGSQLITAILNAKNSGATSYTIPTQYGQYRFGSTTTQGSRQVFIKLLDMDNFTLDCNDATFWFEDDRLGIYIGSSVNFTIKRLNIDWDPLPFTQATITSVNSNNNSMRVRLDTGYGTVTPRFANLASSTTNPTVRGAIIGADGRFKSRQNLFSVWPFLSTTPNSDGTYTVYTRPFYERNISTVNPVAGDKVVFWIRGDGAFLIEGCENVQLTNIDVFASSGISFKDAGGVGGIVYRDCNIVRRSGTSRLLAGNSDGFHSENAQYGPLIEQADVNSIGDDAVNVHGRYSKVMAVEGPRSIVVQQIAWRGNLGSLTYDFTRQDDYAPLGRRTATATLITYNGVTAHRLTLTSDLTGVAVDDMVSCTNFVGQNATIQHNRFTNILTRGILFRSINGTITDNDLNWVGLFGIALMPQPENWGESTYNDTVSVTSNRLTDTYVFADADGNSVTRAAIFAYAPGYTLGSRQKSLIIGSNTITRPGRHGIAATGVNTLTMWYNNIDSYGNMLAGNGINLTTVSGLSMGSNTYTAGTYGAQNFVQQ